MVDATTEAEPATGPLEFFMVEVAGPEGLPPGMLGALVVRALADSGLCRIAAFGHNPYRHQETVRELNETRTYGIALQEQLVASRREVQALKATLLRLEGKT